MQHFITDFFLGFHIVKPMMPILALLPTLFNYEKPHSSAYEEISVEQLYRTTCQASLTKQMVYTVTQSYFHIALLGSTVDWKQSNQIINL